MAFTEERRTDQNPAKLVFAVKNAQAAYDAVLAGGGVDGQPALGERLDHHFRAGHSFGHRFVLPQSTCLAQSRTAKTGQ